MAVLKFAHISDTHVLRSYDRNALLKNAAPYFDPVKNLERAIEWINGLPDIQFVAITGDLVHEGAKEDYELFGRIIKKSKCPVHVTLGNHDNHDSWFEVFGEYAETGRLDYCIEDYAYPCVFLDTTVPGLHTGAVSDEHIQFINSVARRHPGKKLLVFQHHPLVWSIPRLSMDEENLLESGLKELPILGVFTGHTHENTLCWWQGIPQYTAQSSAFGIRRTEDSIILTDEANFSLYEINDDMVSFKIEHLAPSLKDLGSILIKDIGNREKH